MILRQRSTPVPEVGAIRRLELGRGRPLRPSSRILASALGAVFGQSPDYDPPITNGQQENQPNIYAPAFPGSLFTGPPLPPNPPVGANGRYPLPDGINVFYFVDPPSSYRIPLAEFWNLTVQHQFRSSLTAEAAYVGNVGRHLYTNPNANQAVPGPKFPNSSRRRRTHLSPPHISPLENEKSHSTNEKSLSTLCQGGWCRKGTTERT